MCVRGASSAGLASFVTVFDLSLYYSVYIYHCKMSVYQFDPAGYLDRLSLLRPGGRGTNATRLRSVNVRKQLTADGGTSKVRRVVDHAEATSLLHCGASRSPAERPSHWDKIR